MPPSEIVPAPSATLGPWLRLLWNLAPPLLHLPRDEDDTEPAPHLSRRGLHLPSAPAGLDAAAAARWQRAAAAHAAAHLVFSRAVFVREGTAPITQALLGLLEDARAETLAARELPGLGRLWAAWHAATPADGEGFETLLLRLARALADRGYEDPHPWVRKGRALFWRDAGLQVLAEPDPQAMRRLASALGHDLGQMRTAFNPRLYRPGPSYRDDNRWLWHSDESQVAAAAPAPAPAHAGRTREATESDGAMTVWRYPEWDHRIGRQRRDWCTVHEAVASGGVTALREPPAPEPTLMRVLALAARRSRLARSRAPQGDELDTGEAVQLMALLRGGVPPGDPRPYRRVHRAPRRVAALLLVDTSASSADPVAGGGCALDRQRGQAAALAQAMHATGWQVAVQGFCSEGRQRVSLRRVLDFGQPWDAGAAARLAGLEAGLSTRLGAALRHAARTLATRSADSRWVLVLGDGEPHDIDVFDTAYLAQDARHAVREARRAGVRCACLLPFQPTGPQGSVPRGIFGIGAVRQVPASGPAALIRPLTAVLAS